MHKIHCAFRYISKSILHGLKTTYGKKKNRLKLQKCLLYWVCLYKQVRGKLLALEMRTLVVVFHFVRRNPSVFCTKWQVSTFTPLH